MKLLNWDSGVKSLFAEGGTAGCDNLLRQQNKMVLISESDSETKRKDRKHEERNFISKGIM